MCYAIPAKVLEIKGDIAIVDYGGVIKEVNHTLVSGLEVGDYILIHAGFAIERLSQQSAKESLEIIKRDLAQFDSAEVSKQREEMQDRLKPSSS